MIAMEASLPGGSCPLQVFAPPQDRAASTVLLFMDAFGPRPALFVVAEQLAWAGQRVIIPHLFYDQLPYAPLRPEAVFGGDAAERQRLMTLFQSIDQAKIDADLSALLQFVEGRWSDGAICATGYCMGGRYALTAAALSPKVRLAASFHGSNLALDRDESPHRRLGNTNARIYVGVAGIDPTFEAAEEGRLAEALRGAGVDHAIEMYAGCHHGFVMQDLPVYNAAGAERHLSRLTTNMREILAA